MIDPIRFKFRFVDDKGAESGSTTKGSFNGETLSLGTHTIPAAALLRSVRRFNRLFIAALDAQAQTVTIAVAIKSGSAPHLLTAINQLASARWAQLRREHLHGKGEGHRHVVEPCPHCHCTIELTDMPRTAQVYCPFCHAVSTHGGKTACRRSEVSPLRQLWILCVARGFHDLLLLLPDRVLRVFHAAGPSLPLVHARRSLEDARRKLPVRAGHRALAGAIDARLPRRRSPERLFQRTGRRQRAGQKERRRRRRALLSSDRRPIGLLHGVRYNHGLAYLLADRPEGATVQFQRALLDCANYRPAYDALATCYTNLGRHDALTELQRLWGDQEDEALPADA